MLKIAGSETSRTYVVNELSEFSTEGGPLRWTVDYVSAGGRLLAAVRPAAGTLYQLAVSKSGAGSGIVRAGDGVLDCGPDCTARYLDGTSVVLTAAATDAYSSFTGWGGDCSGTTSTVTVTMDAAKTCTATFTREMFTLTVLKTGEGADESGAWTDPEGIDCGPTCAASFGGGTTVHLTAYPGFGFELAGWQNGCAFGTVTMAGPVTCTAVFRAVPPSCDPDGCLQAECRSLGGQWDPETCACQNIWQDPLVLTLDGRPVRLTDVGGGVSFDMEGNGIRQPVAWTQAGSTTAFLVLDLDGDGAIATGAELFGMPVGAPRHQKPAASDNSFTLLAVYDTPALGGNGDGIISAADTVFSRLRLWTDVNHDGVSQPGELVSLAAAGIVSIDLSYETLGRRDGHGNYARYRGAVHLTSGRTVPIWDVFLATGPKTGSAPEPDGEVQPLDENSAFDTPSREWGGTGAGPDGDVALPAGSAALDPPPLQVVEYYHLDALGSVRAVTDAQGQVLRRHDFLPFGEELNGQFPPHERKLFAGQERDFETGLDYLHARELRVDLGRFTAPDPLTNVAWTDSNRGASSTYGYVWSNPLRYVDPTGLEGDEVWVISLDDGTTIFATQLGFEWIIGNSPNFTFKNGVVSLNGATIGSFLRVGNGSSWMGGSGVNYVNNGLAGGLTIIGYGGKPVSRPPQKPYQETPQQKACAAATDKSVDHALQTYGQTFYGDFGWAVSKTATISCYVGLLGEGCLSTAAVSLVAGMPAIVAGSVLHATWNAYKEAFTDPTGVAAKCPGQ